MDKITFKQAKRSYDRLNDYLFDELKDYECTYNVDNAENIPTKELNKEHVYTDSRILDDYFVQQGVSNDKF